MDSSEFTAWQVLLSTQPLHAQSELQHAEMMCLLHNIHSDKRSEVSDFIRDYWNERKPPAPDDVFDKIAAILVKKTK